MVGILRIVYCSRTQKSSPKISLPAALCSDDAAVNPVGNGVHSLPDHQYSYLTENHLGIVLRVNADNVLVGLCTLQRLRLIGPNGNLRIHIKICFDKLLVMAHHRQIRRSHNHAELASSRQTYASCKPHETGNLRQHAALLFRLNSRQFVFCFRCV